VHMHPDCSTKKIRGTFPKHLRDVNMHLERLNQQISKLTKITPVKSHNKLKKNTSIGTESRTRHGRLGSTTTKYTS